MGPEMLHSTAFRHRLGDRNPVAGNGPAQAGLPDAQMMVRPPDLVPRSATGPKYGHGEMWHARAKWLTKSYPLHLVGKEGSRRAWKHCVSSPIAAPRKNFVPRVCVLWVSCGWQGTPRRAQIRHETGCKFVGEICLRNLPLAAASGCLARGGFAPIVRPRIPHRCGV